MSTPALLEKSSSPSSARTGSGDRRFGGGSAAGESVILEELRVDTTGIEKKVCPGGGCCHFRTA